MSRHPLSRILLGSSLALLGLASCDAAKKFLDPTGRSYGDTASAKTPAATPANASKPAEKSSAPTVAAPAPSPSRKASPTQRDVPPLTSQSALSQASEMLLSTPDGWAEFHKGRAVSRGRNLTILDERESPWGLAITDLDQDGAEDAILVVRSTSRSDTSWILAILTDHAGKLQCVQSIPLSGIDGVASLEATQGGVLLSTRAGETRLFGWVGGELVGN